MARYNIFDGGNELRHYDDPTSGVKGYDNVRPANHHVDRKRHIMYHVNTGARPFVNENNPVIIQHNDEIATHLIGAGWVISAVGIHVKQAGKGQLHPLITLGNGTKINLADYTASTADLETVGGYAETAKVNLSEVGYKWLRPLWALPGAGGVVHREVLNEAGVGYLTHQWTSTEEVVGEEAMSGCFGIILELTYLEDDYACNCVTVPCPTEFPAPICSPNIGS